MSHEKVFLLYGGISGEHEVSLLSASSVFSALDKTKYDVFCVGGDKQGNFFETPADCFENIKHTDPLPVSVEKSKSVALSVDYLKQADVVLPIMHGPLYEDGCLQGLLELSRVAYVGSGHLASGMSMDKAIAKLLVEKLGIKVAPYLILDKSFSETDMTRCLNDMVQQYQFPLFVKPACLGSSVGTHRVENEKALFDAVQDAFRYDQKILVEKAIIGREIELAVLKQKYQISVSIAGEISMVDKSDFYSYQAKYADKEVAELIIPAELDGDLLENLQDKAKRIFVILGCDGLARVDFFVDEQNQIVFNEINTLPGFTKISMYPKLWQASGISYRNLLTKLIEQAQWRFQQTQSCLRDFK